LAGGETRRRKPSTQNSRLSDHLQARNQPPARPPLISFQTAIIPQLRTPLAPLSANT